MKMLLKEKHYKKNKLEKLVRGVKIILSNHFIRKILTTKLNLKDQVKDYRRRIWMLVCLCHQRSAQDHLISKRKGERKSIN